MQALASALIGAQGEKVALRDAAVSMVLRDLLSEVTVTQTYRNEERVNIEAVYTFPLPLEAVLLDLEVQIGERVLKGAVVEKKAAEARYEEAVSEGDAAVMLEVLEPGLYTLNVGNLLPGEQARIRFTYTLLYRWSGERLRMLVPTTIAPRFGASPHAPHQAPESSLMVENRFSLSVRIEGLLRGAQFTCPSHPVTLAQEGEATLISLSQENAVMDRDFILQVRAPQATRGFALTGADGEATAALASFQPFFPGLTAPRALKLAVVVDCSGSMNGESMQQARQALAGMLDSLTPEDEITLIAFGDTTRALSRRLLPCDARNLEAARQFAAQLQADMGGTEIGGALKEAYGALKGAKHADIFLITDGEVSQWETVVRDAKRTGHRVFTVGVGHAVSEAFVRGLAAQTGGGCELVSPREQMAERVIRHFERMRAPRARRVEIRWPEGARDVFPARVGAVFEGDTVIASAHLPQAGGTVVLEIETENGEIARQELALAAGSETAADGPSSLARLTTAMRLVGCDAATGAPLALHYRLLSPWTNWLAIAVRAESERAEDLPALRKVPQTLAAGWGGAGAAPAGAPQVFRSVAASPVMAESAAMLSVRAPAPMMDAAPLPRSLRKMAKPGPAEPPRTGFLDVLRGRTLKAPTAAYRKLVQLLEDQPSFVPAQALGLLQQSGMDAPFDSVFREAAEAGAAHETVAVLLLAALFENRAEDELPDALRAALHELRDEAQRIALALRDLALQGRALAGALHAQEAGGVLDAKRQQAAHAAIERLAQLGELPRVIGECADGVVQRLTRETNGVTP
ncbi:MAG TPA: VIT and VWA domain-containing protein [Burkholderiales bacterium]